MKICVNSGLPIAVVACLHIYIKRKLWGRRTQKCKPFVGANSVRSSTVLQTTRFHADQWKFADIRGYLSPWYYVCTKAILIGASLSEPHTSGTAFWKCVCNVLVCLRPYTVNFKCSFKYFSKTERPRALTVVGEGYCATARVQHWQP